MSESFNFIVEFFIGYSKIFRFFETYLNFESLNFDKF